MLCVDSGQIHYAWNFDSAQRPLMQDGSTAYLGMTRVVSGQFLCIEKIQCNATAKHDRKEPKKKQFLS